MDVLDVREALGRAVGGILAPIVAEASLARGAPVFHADGVVLEAEVEPGERIGETGPGNGLLSAFVALGASLQGKALVRFSNAVRRYEEGKDPPDVLGAAIRFGASTAKPQDLVFATFRTVPEILVAPFRTDPHDYLANDYYTVLPSRVPGTGSLVVFRLVPEAGVHDGKDRVDRLHRAVASGTARLHLEGRAADGGRYLTIASITLKAEARAAALDANPFRDGAGIVPAGFFQAVRAAVYPASMLGARVAKGPGTRE